MPPTRFLVPAALGLSIALGQEPLLLGREGRLRGITEHDE